jgi:hypothetical protein
MLVSNWATTLVNIADTEYKSSAGIPNAHGEFEVISETSFAVF